MMLFKQKTLIKTCIFTEKSMLIGLRQDGNIQIQICLICLWDLNLDPLPTAKVEMFNSDSLSVSLVLPCKNT